MLKPLLVVFEQVFLKSTNPPSQKLQSSLSPTINVELKCSLSIDFIASTLILGERGPQVLEKVF